MGRFRDRLRRLEDRFRGRSGPGQEEAQRAWERIAASANAKLSGEAVDKDQHLLDRDTVYGWARAEGADLDGEAERARQKLMDVQRKSL